MFLEATINQLCGQETDLTTTTATATATTTTTTTSTPATANQVPSLFVRQKNDQEIEDKLRGNGHLPEFVPAVESLLKFETLLFRDKTSYGSSTFCIRQ